MSDQLLLRDIPSHVTDWIEDERHERRMTKKAFVISVLNRACSEPAFPSLFDNHSGLQLRSAESIPFTFVDFFAGIGGLRFGLEKAGGDCLYSCEWDKYSQKTYKAWFGETPHGDIRQIDPASIPDHDVLAAGFPCQPFSLAGVSKKNSLGREHGFKC